jgi:hypothetical protein
MIAAGKQPPELTADPGRADRSAAALDRARSRGRHLKARVASISSIRSHQARRPNRRGRVSSTNGTATLANREIARVLPANDDRKGPFSGAAKHANEPAAAAYFGGSSGEFPEIGTRLRSGVDSNCRCR